MTTSVLNNSALTTIEAQGSYGIGLQIGQQLKESGLEGLQPENLLAGLTDVLAGNIPAVPVEAINRALQEMHEKADKVRLQRQAGLVESGKQFLADNAKAEGVTVTESGLQFKVLTQGTGTIPAKQDRVSVHYTGRLVSGEVFDSSVERGEPAEFPVNGVIAGWIEALSMMPVGSKWQLTIPHDLAYGERGAGSSIPPFSTLIFDVELLAIL